MCMDHAQCVKQDQQCTHHVELLFVCKDVPGMGMFPGMLARQLRHRISDI